MTVQFAFKLFLVGLYEMSLSVQVSTNKLFSAETSSNCFFLSVWSLELDSDYFYLSVGQC